MNNITLTVINILAVLLSPIIALWISNIAQDNKEKRKEKVQILKVLMTQRFTTKNIEYVNALNLIDIVFVDSKSVRGAYKNLYNEYATTMDLNIENNKQIYLDKIKKATTQLIEAIIKEIGYKDKITWDEIQEPYVPQWLSDEVFLRTELSNAQVQFANFVKTLTPQNNVTSSTNNTTKNNEDNINDK